MRTGAEIRAVLGKITAGDAVNITDATNAEPIVVTAAAHGLQTGDKVVIASVGGNTNANGVHTATRVSANTFSIPVAGNAAYTSGGTVRRIYSALTATDVEELRDALNRVPASPTQTLQSLESRTNL